MAKKRLYKCDECGARRFVSAAELSRRAKPRCSGCGSTRLDIVSDDAADEMRDVTSSRLVQRSLVDKKGNR